MVNIFDNFKKKWVITYFNDKVFDEIRKLPIKLKARYIALTDFMVERGPNLGPPHTKSLGDELFELRIKAQEGIARVFYCVQVNHQIVVLHSFIKKKQQIPKRELLVARNRLKEVLENG